MKRNIQNWYYGEERGVDKSNWKILIFEHKYSRFVRYRKAPTWQPLASRSGHGCEICRRFFMRLCTGLV